MKRWLGLFAVLGVMVAAAVFVSLYLRTLTPEGQYRRFSERCDKIRIGMTQAELDAIFGEDTSNRPVFGIGVGGPPWDTKVIGFRPTGPGDTRYLEVTFTYGVVAKKRMRTTDEQGRLSDPPGQ